jgi:hypothetical protein
MRVRITFEVELMPGWTVSESAGFGDVLVPAEREERQVGYGPLLYFESLWEDEKGYTHNVEHISVEDLAMREIGCKVEVVRR